MPALPHARRQVTHNIPWSSAEGSEEGLSDAGDERVGVLADDYEVDEG